MTNKTEFIIDIKQKGANNVKQLKDSVENLNAATNKTEASGKKLNNGIDKLDKNAKKAGKQVETLGQKSEKFGKAAAAAAAIAAAALLAYTKKIIENAAAFNTLSNDVNISVESLQAISEVAISAGRSTEGVVDGIKKLTEGIQEAASIQSGPIFEVFSQMGIDAKNFIDLKPEEQLKKLSKEFNNFSKADKIYFTEKMGLGDLDVILKDFEAVEERSKYLRENGLLMSKDELTNLNNFADEFSLLLSDINSFSTILVNDVYTTLQDIFELSLDGKNTILNREVAESIGTFFSRIIIVFKMMYETIVIAGKGIGSLVDKGVYMSKTLGIYFDLLVANLTKIKDKLSIVFENFSMKEVIGKMKAHFDAFIARLQQKIGEIQISLGKLFNSQTLAEAGMEKVRQSVEAQNQAGRDWDSVDNNAEVEAKLNAADIEYQKKKRDLKVEIDALDATNAKRTRQNSNEIADSFNELDKLYDMMIYKNKTKKDVSEEELKIEKSKVAQLAAQNQLMKEMENLDKLRLEYMRLEGKELEVNEIARQKALEQVAKDYTDTAKRMEAENLTNKIFDYNKFKIEYSKVSTDLEDLKERLSNTSIAFNNEEYLKLQDEIKRKTEEQIALEEELNIKRKEAYENQFLSQKDLMSINQASVSALTSSFKDYVKGVKSGEDAIGDFLGNIAEKLLDVIAQQLVLNAVTALYGKKGATGEAGIATSIAGMIGGSNWAASLGAMAGSIFHNGGEIEQSNLIKPDGMNFKHDEGLIVAKAGEKIETKNQQINNNYSSGGPTTVEAYLTIGQDSVAERIMDTKTFDRKMKEYMKRNGPLMKNYFKD